MKKVAFLVHPRGSLKEDMGKVNPIFYLFPESFLKKIIPLFPPVVGGKIKFMDSGEAAGWIIWVTLSAEQMMTFPKAAVFKKILDAAKLAKKMGAEIIGLGELTSPLTHGGIDLFGKLDGVVVTTGNSLTAAMVIKSVQSIAKIKKMNLSSEIMAIVGAGGSIGRGVASFFIRDKQPLILIDKENKLLELKNILPLPGDGTVVFSSDISKIKEAKIVIVATSSTESLIKPEYLGNNSVVYDITQPKNTSPEILRERPDVTIVDGGIIDTPRIDYGVDIGLKKNQAYACLAETMICGMEEVDENYTGFAGDETISKMMEFYARHRQDFIININQSFGQDLDENLELRK
jgi:predicted amino acid dehydrogenase